MGARESGLFGMHVLAVEDDGDTRDVLHLLLRYSGASVSAVASAGEGLTVLTAIDPSVVITDMVLEDGDGLALFREARRRGIRAPFIAISGKDFDPDTVKGVGFAAYLRKPFEHDELIDAIRTVVSSRLAA